MLASIFGCVHNQLANSRQDSNGSNEFRKCKFCDLCEFHFDSVNNNKKMIYYNFYLQIFHTVSIILLIVSSTILIIGIVIRLINDRYIFKYETPFVAGVFSAVVSWWNNFFLISSINNLLFCIDLWSHCRND